MIKRKVELQYMPLPNCHGGEGILQSVTKFKETELSGTSPLLYVNNDKIPPKASIGVHHHTDREEYYYIVSGEGMMILNDDRFKVSQGDSILILPSVKHGISNHGPTDLEILVIGIKLVQEP